VESSHLPYIFPRRSTLQTHRRYDLSRFFYSPSYWPSLDSLTAKMYCTDIGMGHDVVVSFVMPRKKTLLQQELLIERQHQRSQRKTTVALTATLATTVQKVMTGLREQVRSRRLGFIMRPAYGLIMGNRGLLSLYLQPILRCSTSRKSLIARNENPNGENFNPSL
jgi:hypothetical protein